MKSCTSTFCKGETEQRRWLATARVPKGHKSEPEISEALDPTRVACIWGEAAQTASLRLAVGETLSALLSRQSGRPIPRLVDYPLGPSMFLATRPKANPHLGHWVLREDCPSRDHFFDLQQVSGKSLA